MDGVVLLVPSQSLTQEEARSNNLFFNINIFVNEFTEKHLGKTQMIHIYFRISRISVIE